MESLPDIVRFAASFFFGRRVRLIVFYASGGAIDVPPIPAIPGTPPPPALPPGLQINHHSLVIQNIGLATAHNVRIGHLRLDGVKYRVINAVPIIVRSEPPSTEVEFVIPVMPPNWQVQIDYLYFPPAMVATVNTYVICDEGQAEVRYLLQAWRMSNTMKIALTVFGLACLFALGTALYFFVPWFAEWIKSILPRF